MRTLTRDVTAAAGLTAAVLVSLMIVRVTASEPRSPPLTTTRAASQAPGPAPAVAAT